MVEKQLESLYFERYLDTLTCQDKCDNQQLVDANIIFSDLFLERLEQYVEKHFEARDLTVDRKNRLNTIIHLLRHDAHKRCPLKEGSFIELENLMNAVFTNYSESCYREQFSLRYPHSQLNMDLEEIIDYVNTTYQIEYQLLTSLLFVSEEQYYDFDIIFLLTFEWLTNAMLGVQNACPNWLQEEQVSRRVRDLLSLKEQVLKIPLRKLLFAKSYIFLSLKDQTYTYQMEKGIVQEMRKYQDTLEVKKLLKEINHN